MRKQLYDTYLGIYFLLLRQLVLTPICYIKILKINRTNEKTDLLLLLLVTFNRKKKKNDFTKDVPK